MNLYVLADCGELWGSYIYIYNDNPIVWGSQFWRLTHIFSTYLVGLASRCHRTAIGTEADARPGYAAYDASEYLDEPEVLQATVRAAP